jgi:hypothetical protein
VAGAALRRLGVAAGGVALLMANHDDALAACYLGGDGLERITRC